ncbi:MAG: peptidylprolyl isomerase, partial [Pseudomonadota bacterium]
MRQLIAVLVAGFAFGALAQDDPNPVVAIVEGEPIYLEDVRQAALSLPPELGGLPFGMVFDRVLDRLIDVRLVAQAGRAQGLGDDAEVQARIRDITDRVIQEVLLTRTVEAQMTEDGLRARYQDWLRANAGAREIRLRQILVGSEARAGELLDAALNGADFAALARDSSLGPEAVQGGDLGFVSQGDLPDPVIAAALDTPSGSLATAPVRSVFGWHVLLVEGTRTKPAPSFIEARPILVREWSAEIIAETVSDLRDGASIDIYDVTPGDRPAGSSGDPRWSAPANGGTPRDRSNLIIPNAQMHTADAVGGVLRGLADAARDLWIKTQLSIPQAGSTPQPTLAPPAAGLSTPRDAEGRVVAIDRPDQPALAPFAP